MSPIIDVRTPESFAYGCLSGGPRLSSRIVTIRVGYSFEPNAPLVDNSNEASDAEEDGNESISLRPVPGAWPKFFLDETNYPEEDKEGRGKDESKSDVNSQFQDGHKGTAEESEDSHNTSYIRFLLYDELEEDLSDDENDKDYECESAEEVEEEYDDFELEIGSPGIFYVHEDVLRSSSIFFDAALRESWRERASGEVDLPDLDAKTFAIYAEWLYTGHLSLTSTANKPSPSATLTENVAEKNQWLNCYEAGDYLQDTDFKDTLIDAAAQTLNGAKDKCFALHFGGIFDWTKKASPQRKFVVDTCVAGFHSSSTVQNITDLVARRSNQDMATVLLIAYAKCIIEKLDPVRPWELANLCEYHEHTMEGGKCYKDKRGNKS